MVSSGELRWSTTEAEHRQGDQGGSATGIRVSLLPMLAELATSHPRVEVIISEYEPIEAFSLLAGDNLDLALTYDYNLAPAAPDAALESVALWRARWGLAVPADAPDTVELVEDLILAGYGVGLLPIGRTSRAGLKVLPLNDPGVVMTAYAVVRRGRATWPALRLVLDRLRPGGRLTPLERWPRESPRTTAPCPWR